MVIECIDKGEVGHAAVYLVKRAAGGDEMVIGMLEKFPNTKYDHHPWKAFAHWGAGREFLGAFYPEQGGREAAIYAIEQAVA